VLVQHLPPGGAAYRAVNGHGWTEAHYMLADLYDAVAENTTAVYRSVAGRGKRVSNPRKYPRPGDKGYGKPIGDRGGRSTAEVVSYLDSLKPPNAKGA
jgi:hypothetical protein